MSVQPPRTNAKPPGETQSPPIENFLAAALPKPQRQRQTINENVCCFDWFLTWFTGLRGNKWNRTFISRTVKWREQQQNISLLDFETANTIIFAQLASKPQRPGMTSPLKKLLAACPKTGPLAARANSIGHITGCSAHEIRWENWRLGLWVQCLGKFVGLGFGWG